MDSIDSKILNLLRQNSRTNASDIAEVVKLSVSAVIERIKKLETNGTVKQYTLIINPAKVGKDVMALISVSIEHPRYNEDFENAIIANRSIMECNYIAGDYDYLLRVVTTNTQSLERILFEIKSIKGVARTKTHVILSVIKEEHSVHVSATKKSI